MPNALLIDGEIYPLRTDFRAGIEYQMMAAAGKLTAASLYKIWFVDRFPSNIVEALEGIKRFFLRKDEEPKEPKRGPIPYDFTVDADVIASGFLCKYGIDITSSRTEMHWWRFMALLEGLVAPDFARRVEIRTKDLSGMKSKERSRWMKLRNEYAIHTNNETAEDHLAMLDRIAAEHGGECDG